MSDRCWAHCLVLVIAIAISGCKGVECDQYRELVADPARTEALLNWADREVFSRTFAESDFRVAGMMGPGRYGGNFMLDRANILVPDWLSGYNIRAVGPNKLHPDVLLIGARRYQGIVVARGEFAESIGKTTVSLHHLENRAGRLGVMCH